MIVGLLSTAPFQYLKCQAQRISKNCRSNGFPKTVETAIHEISEGRPFLYLTCQGGGAHPWPPVSYVTAYGTYWNSPTEH